ncbi:MAG TPA: aminotransferase class I/II-fold pyridoxal phosphate-dependent enzyme, partial [Acidimicrobiales bacterium]
MSDGWTQRVGEQLARTRADGRWRVARSFDARGPEGTLAADDGGTPASVVSFASNDYLGLSRHPAVVAAAHAALDRWGTGSGGSRLVTGSRPVHEALEHALAAWKGTDAAVCYPTGFAANLGVLSALGGPGTRILSDELNHASIIDGCRLSRAAVTVFRHGDAEQVASLLATDPTPTVVVTDGVFSMDGDVAPLPELAAACRRYGAALVVDEAHAVMGPTLGPDVTEDLLVVR